MKSPSIPAEEARSSPKQDWEELGQRWWAHIQFLADDSLEGRDTGSPGLDKAADYMERQFRAVGLEPAGVEGFRQRMEFDVTRIDESHCSVEMIRNGVSEPVILGEDAVLIVGSGTAENVDGEAVFVGYGLNIPEADYNDFAGLDVRGKIAVYFMGGPPEIPSAVKAHYQSLDERRKTFGKVGAVGTAAIQNPKAIELPWSRIAASRFQPRMELRDPGYDVPPPLPFGIGVNVDRAGKLFKGSEHDFADLLTKVREGQPLPHFPLGLNFRAKVSTVRSRVTSQNVVGVWPGSDPDLRKEYVVLSAHLDHVGIGEPINGDRIYSGAMDNASGCASLIEVAWAIRSSGARPRRSMMFLAVTGEEKGLLGSQYYANHPTVAGPFVANLNMDMFNPLFPLKHLEVQGLGESSLGDDIRAVASAAGVEVQPDQEPEHVLFIRSDQYSFIKRGVPALAFKFSYLPSTPEEKIFKAWLTERYHAPLDDLNQPVDRAAAAQFNFLLEKLALRVADSDRRPEWKTDSFFRRFAQ